MTDFNELFMMEGNFESWLDERLEEAKRWTSKVYTHGKERVGQVKTAFKQRQELEKVVTQTPTSNMDVRTLPPQNQRTGDYWQFTWDEENTPSDVVMKPLRKNFTSGNGHVHEREDRTVVNNRVAINDHNVTVETPSTSAEYLSVEDPEEFEEELLNIKEKAGKLTTNNYALEDWEMDDNPYVQNVNMNSQFERGKLTFDQKMSDQDFDELKKKWFSAFGKESEDEEPIYDRGPLIKRDKSGTSNEVIYVETW